MARPLPTHVVRGFDGEARIILPCFNNAGFCLDRLAAELRKRLIARFGGYTQTNAHGGFLSGMSTADYESVRVFDVACDASPQTYSDLIALASWLAREAKQDCVYLRMTSGIVYLVDGSGP